MSVYYKFNSELNCSHVGFDGLHISVIDLKKAIFHQKRLGKTADFDLLISNAQTKEEYIEDDCLIPKNTSLIVARVPLSSNSHKKWEHQQPQTSSNFHASEQHATSASTENVDLSKMNGSEEDKIQAMMTQSTLDYDPSNYQRVRGMQQTGEVPAHYRCHRCHKSGHWIKNCPQNPPPKDHHSMKVRTENKKMTGIPRSLRENPPKNTKDADSTPIPEVRKEVPEDLICSICKNIFKDAVMIPCCGSSFCDECIRTALLESDDNECPDCSEKGTSPGSLIPNRFLRNAVSSFLSDVNSSASREKQPETLNIQAEEATTPVLESEVEEQEKVFDAESEPKIRRSKDSKSDDERETNENDDGSDGSDEEEDNITVTVPTASQQSGPGFRYETNNYAPNPNQDWEPPVEKYESNNLGTADGPPGSHHYNNSNNSYDGPQKSSNAPPNTYQIENLNKGFPSSIMNNPPGAYHHQQQQHIYNSHPQQPQNVHGPPSHHHQFQNHGQRFPSGMPMHHGSNYYGPPQNMRPMRYDQRDHHRNMHDGKYHQQHHSMHMGIRDNYDMRYQSSTTSANVANMVSQNIQQRFGTGIIDDPLEAFNKIMKEKEMRRDRFKRSPMRSRSPRQYSPDHHHHHRQKSPLRRRKRSRSFSSSRSYSKSRSRSNDRHYTKENIHRKDFRSKYRSSDRRRSPERGRSLRTKEKPLQEEKSSGKKLNSEEKSDHHRHQQLQPQQQNHENSSRHERHKSSTESNTATATSSIKKPDDIPHDEPPPPGEESSLNLSSNEVETKSVEKQLSPPSPQSNIQVAPENEDEKASSDDTKHAKKSRDKKKHKKEIKNRKKKKRDKKEKKSAQHSRNNTPEIEAQDHKSKLNEDENNHSSTPPPLNDNDNDHLSLNENDDDKCVLGIFEPELSKWERDEVSDEKIDKNEVNDNVTSTEITSDIIKRAESAMFSKSFHSNDNNKANTSENIPSVIKKIDGDKKYESFQVTVAADLNSGTRSVDLQRDDHKETKKSNEASSTQQRTSIKDRLGKKIDGRKRSSSRDRKPTKKDNNDKRNYQMNSTISSSVHRPSGRNDKRSARRSRTPEFRRHKRSRTASPNRGVVDRQDRKQRDKPHDDKVERSSKQHSNLRQERDKRSRSASYSPKQKQSQKDNERKRSRSRSSESRKYRKKKKKEKKTKKHKSKERK